MSWSITASPVLHTFFKFSTFTGSPRSSSTESCTPSGVQTRSSAHKLKPVLHYGPMIPPERPLPCSSNLTLIQNLNLNLYFWSGLNFFAILSSYCNPWPNSPARKAYSSLVATCCGDLQRSQQL